MNESSTYEITSTDRQRHPYELEEAFILKNGTEILIRTLTPFDRTAHRHFHEQLSDVDIRMRHFATIRELSSEQLDRFIDFDDTNEMAFIAVRETETVGVIRIFMNNAREADFAVIIRSDYKSLGLGHALLTKAEDFCQQRGISNLKATTLNYNYPMIALAGSHGYTITRDVDGTLLLVKKLVQKPIPFYVPEIFIEALWLPGMAAWLWAAQLFQGFLALMPESEELGESPNSRVWEHSLLWPKYELPIPPHRAEYP